MTPSRAIQFEAPSSVHFTPLDLAAIFNATREDLPESFGLSTEERSYGSTSFRGIPFEFGSPERPNVVLLDRESVSIELDSKLGSYIVIAHVVETSTRPTPPFGAPAGYSGDGQSLGDLVSEYRLDYDDGTSTTVPIVRRFAIQQGTVVWGSSPFAAVPAEPDRAVATVGESLRREVWPELAYGLAEMRHESGRDRLTDAGAPQMWIYALPNPCPDRPIRRIVCAPKTAQSVIYGITLTDLCDHPLRSQTRQKLRLPLPVGVSFNDIGELDNVAIDLGTVISARAVLDYSDDKWNDSHANVQPDASTDEVLIEFAAHPEGVIYFQAADGASVGYSLKALVKEDPRAVVASATRPVRISVREMGASAPVPVRLHLHGEAGEYLPPRGYNRVVNPGFFEDNYGEFINGLNQYCYIPGECVVDLPVGEVHIEISRGFEVVPIRTKFVVEPETEEITFELENVVSWRERGWVSADTHVHFLSPQTAHLEGQAEGVNVVNLLASQWGEMFSNVSDFDGSTTIGADERSGEGEFLVRVGTENRMQVLGHVSLLGYSGQMIGPLCTGGPTESAIGDPLESTIGDWAQRCIDQGGLVVLPHFPNPQCEGAADIVLGLVDAVEMVSENPYDSQINPYGLLDWYRYLNLGYHIPVVGGSDKMSAASLLGGIRTYARLRDVPLTYENWMTAVKEGNTFVTVGPLVEMNVDGICPGGQLSLGTGGGTVAVAWNAESVAMPIDSIEIVKDGLVIEETSCGGALSANGSSEVTVEKSSWLAVRVRGSHQAKQGDIAAHTSAVQALVAEEPLFSRTDASRVLDQIQGAIAYVDTLAPAGSAARLAQLRFQLESAYNQLHQRMHRSGQFHRHTPLHDHARHHEH